MDWVTNSRVGPSLTARPTGSKRTRNTFLRGLPLQTKTAPATTANEVWVNTRSGKYWKPGSRFYGKTKQGEFMSELEALDRGYSPAGGTGQ
jgi:hypothetical protein